MPPSAEARIPPHVAEAVETTAQLHAAAERDVSPPQRSIEALAQGFGRPVVVATMAALVLAWMALNVVLRLLGHEAVDPPPFVWTQTACSIGALLIATIVLTAQNRQRLVADERARLDLQVNLLAEQKVAKVIALLEELRHDMPNVADREDPLARAMTEAVDPHAIANALKETLASSPSPGPAKR
jgi:uncharacterized membrane protein